MKKIKSNKEQHIKLGILSFILLGVMIPLFIYHPPKKPFIPNEIRAPYSLKEAWHARKKKNDPLPIEEEKSSATFLLKNVSASSVQGTKKNVIYGTNYSTIALRLGNHLKENSHLLSLLDLRGHVFNNGEWALNGGYIGRYFPKSSSLLFGWNAYYDGRNGRRKFYNGLGLGMEVLGEHWDFRANGYFPIGEKEGVDKDLFLYPGGWEAERRNREFAATGGNAELGYKFLSKHSYLYIGIGPYYFKGKSDMHATGGILRIRPQYKNILSLGLSASYDNLVKYNLQAELTLSLPLYSCDSWKKSTKNSPSFSNCSLYQPVQRFDVMQLMQRESWQFNWDDSL